MRWNFIFAVGKVIAIDAYKLRCSRKASQMVIRIYFLNRIIKIANFFAAMNAKLI